MRLTGKFLPIFITAVFLLLLEASLYSSDEKRRALERKLSQVNEPCIELELLGQLARLGALTPLEHAIREYRTRTKAGEDPETVFNQILPRIASNFRPGGASDTLILKSDSSTFVTFRNGKVIFKHNTFAFAYNPDRRTVSDVLNENADLIGSVSRLDLSDQTITLADVRTITNFPDLSNLQELNLGHAQGFGVEAAQALSAIRAHNLIHLSLANVEIGDEGIKHLASSPSFQNLEELFIDGSAITHAGVSTIATHLKNLRVLRLNENHIGNEGVKILASSESMAKLTTLGLGDTNIGDEGVQALATSPFLSNLEHLVLISNPITIETITILEKSTTLKKLKAIYLPHFGNGTLNSVVQRLKERFPGIYVQFNY